MKSVINGLNAELTWSAPDSNQETITKYEILIRKYDGTFAEESTNCNGTQSAIVTALKCTIPLTTLRASPFSL